jgi:2-oxoglutarate ferredoxin oxidoreductase subunit alpha
MDAEALEEVNRRLQAKLQRISAEEVRYAEMFTQDADILVVAFGSAGRIAKTAIREARRRGVRVGLLRPITLFPFPTRPLDELAQGSRRVQQVKAILVVEMSAGQMVEDVRLGVQGRVPVHFYGRTGGAVPFPDEILEQILGLAGRLGEAPPGDESYAEELYRAFG